LPKEVFYQLPEIAQERILLAAAELMIEKGYQNFRLDELAERLKVNLDTLKKYFDDFRDVVAAVLGKTIQLFSEAYILVGKLKKPFWERVEYLFEYACARAFQYRALLHVYLNIAAAGLPELAQATHERFEGRAALFFQNLVLSGVQEGALRDDVDVSAIAMHLQTTTRALMGRRAHPLYSARSKAYFPEVPFTEEGDRRLVKRLLVNLKTLYAAR
jgi:AcrR family transcriptional regulator